jgi:hypothetical protein
MHKHVTIFNTMPVLEDVDNVVHLVIDTPGKQLYLRQVECLISKDIESLVEENYNDDANLVSAQSSVCGKPALKKHFRDYLSRVSIKGVKSTDLFVETADAMLFEATIESDTGIVKVYDAFVLKNGKISYHFSGVR